MKTENIYELIAELVKEIKQLRVDLQTTHEAVRELVNGETSPRGSEGRGEPTFTPTASVVSSERTTTQETNERIDTGVVDSRRQRLYVNDRVRLDTKSTGVFSRKRQYKKGDVVVVQGSTRNGDIKVIDPDVRGINHTVRKGANVTKLNTDW